MEAIVTDNLANDIETDAAALLYWKIGEGVKILDKIFSPLIPRSNFVRKNRNLFLTKGLVVIP